MSADLTCPQGPVPFEDPDQFRMTRKTLSIPQRMPDEIEAEKARQRRMQKNKFKWTGLPKDDEPDETEAA